MANPLLKDLNVQTGQIWAFRADTFIAVACGG